MDRVADEEREDSGTGAPFPPPPSATAPALELRLLAHRTRLLRSLDQVANIGCCVLGLIVAYIAFYIPFMFFGVAGGLMNGDISDAVLVVGAVAGVLAAGAALYGLRHLLRMIVRAFFRSNYRETTRWLYHTDMLGLFVDENQTAQILDLIEDTYGLRWMSPPKPRTLEDLLEFAACYFGAYKRLLYGPGRLDAGTVFLGSLTWYAGQRQCVTLGFCCCLLTTTSFITLSCWIFAGLGYINRLAVEACCLDYLLDAPRDPRDADKTGPVAASHGVGAEHAPGPPRG